MSWTGPKDLKAQVARLWERGELLRDAVSGQSRFPLRLTLKGPGSADVTNRFDAVRAWADALASAPHLRLEWLEVRHRVQGLQSLPASAWLNRVDDALQWLGKRREWDRFAELVETTRQANPVLLRWLEKRPLQALQLADEWPRLLAVVAWVANHPHPGVYLRQVDLPGVHTKFIEANRGALAELLDLALPAASIDAAKSGAGRFAGRYGFLEKPIRIRFRILDPAVQMMPGLECPDLTLDAGSFSRLEIAAAGLSHIRHNEGEIDDADAPFEHVFITENEVNFLAFPRVSNALVIFGSGYGWEALARARWLDHCRMYYWGDIDTHGFAILAQLRNHFAHVDSLLMDRATLTEHQSVWGSEEKPWLVDLPTLTTDERALYDDLRDNRLQRGLRLEQERIGFEWLNSRLRELAGVTVIAT